MSLRLSTARAASPTRRSFTREKAPPGLGASLPRVITTFISRARPCSKHQQDSEVGTHRLWSDSRLGAADESEHEVQPHLVAHDPAAGLQSPLPVEEPVQAVDHGPG